MRRNQNNANDFKSGARKLVSNGLVQQKYARARQIKLVKLKRDGQQTA